MTGLGGGPEKIDEELQRLAGSIATLAAENGADQRACDALASLRFRWQSPKLPAIVMGEVSSGKSTLINALLGTALLPDDFRVTTSTWTHLAHGPRLTATAYVQEGTAAGSKVAAVELDPGVDLPVYLTVGGNSRFVARHGKAARVLSVDITTPAEVLQSGLELLDTPGVGGLRAAHRRSTFAALTEADAVIFVTKPGEPLSKSELLTLAEAVDRVSACVVVHTHRDERADADQALQDDLDTLTDAGRWTALLGDAQRAGALAARFAVVPGVSLSASNALRAAGRAAGPVKDNLLKASNIGMLREVLDQQIVARGRTIHRGNIIRLMDVLLGSIRARTDERVTILEGGAAATKAVDAMAALIAKWLAHNGDYWRSEYEAGCGGLPAAIDALARDRVAQLEREYRRKLGDMKAAELKEAVADLAAQPEVAYAEMVRLGGEGIDRAAERVNGLLRDEGLASARDQMAGASAVFGRLAGASDISASVRGDVSHVRSGVLGGMAGVGVAGVMVFALQAAGVAVAAPVLLPFVIGAGLFVGIDRSRQRQAKTVEAAREVLGAVCREIVTTAATQAKQVTLKAKDQVALDIDEALTEEQQRVGKAREALDESAGLTPDERASRLAEAADVLDRVQELAVELAAIEVRVAAGGGDAGQPPTSAAP